MRVNVPALAHQFVDEPPLAGGHDDESDRSGEAHRLVCGLCGLTDQRLPTACAVALGVDDDPTLFPEKRGHGTLGEVLHRIDRLPVASDEQAELLAVQRGLEGAVILDDLHRGVEGERLDDPLQKLGQELRFETTTH